MEIIFAAIEENQYIILRLLLGISLLIIFARIIGTLIGKLGYPEVIGEVIGGILFGPFLIGGFLGIIYHEDVLNPVYQVFYLLGAIIILFSAGLEHTFKEIIKTGPLASMVATGGVVLPFFLGYYSTLFLGYNITVAMIIGATLTATSVAITVRILEDLGKQTTEEAKIIINAAIIDDVLAIAVLAIVVSIVAKGGIVEPLDVIINSLIVLGLWIIILVTSVFTVPRIVNIRKLHESEGIVENLAIAIAISLALLTTFLGLSPILGGFIAGVALAETKIIKRIRDYVHELKLIFGPFFFATIGALFDVTQIFNLNYIFFILLLFVAILGKLFGCGIPVLLFKKNFKNSMIVGSGMVPRGEVGLVIAAFAFTQGIYTGDIYASLIIIVMITTILGPIFLKSLYK